MPPDDKLKDKVEALLEEKMPAIEVKLAEVSFKQDTMLQKLDQMSGTLTDHVNLQTKQELRLAAIEAKGVAAEVAAEKSKDRRRTLFYTSVAAAISATVGFFLKWFLGS